jgi:hypothetical protein
MRPTIALGALHARKEPRHLGLGQIAPHVDQRGMSAGSFRHDAIKLCTPSSLMLPSVIGGLGGCLGFIGAADHTARSLLLTVQRARACQGLARDNAGAGTGAIRR